MAPTRRLLTSMALATSLLYSAAVHYEQPPCQFDEVQGEVQGASGYVCAPKCEDSTYNCPSDVPAAASAQPQCMLQDAERGAYCGLLCQVDSQCPSGGRCQQLKQAEVGLCLYPISFADWARQAATKKLAVGWPSRPGGVGVATFQVAKTYQALQNLKQKYIIDDGDADMLTLKELLSSLSATPATAAPGVAGAVQGMLSSIPFIGGGAAPAAPAALVGAPPVVPAVVGANPAVVDSGSGGILGGWGKFQGDITRFENDMGMGLGPGLSRIAHDTEWNVEHLGNSGAASALLRPLLMMAVIYVGVGSAIKYQSLNARGLDMIPHIGFWMEYPRLVADGVTYMQILVGGVAGGKSPASANDLDGGISRGRGGAGAFEAL